MINHEQIIESEATNIRPRSGSKSVSGPPPGYGPVTSSYRVIEILVIENILENIFKSILVVNRLQLMSANLYVTFHAKNTVEALMFVKNIWLQVVF